MEQNLKKKNLKNRKFTAYAALLAALALAIAIPLNLLASRLGVFWDMTNEKMYELTDTTKNYLDRLDKQVDFYFLLDMDLLAADTGSYSLALYNALEEYAACDNINFISFEPDEDPELTRQLQAEGFQLSRGDMVISCEGRSKHISGSSMYTTYYSTTDSGTRVAESAYFTGENYITGAIDAVVSGRESVVYFLTGHGEKQPENDYTNLAANLNTHNYGVDSLNLEVVSEVPEDAACVIVAGPQKDISNDELRKLEEFLEIGGNVALWMSPNAADIRYRNLETIMESFGIAMDYDRVYETNDYMHIVNDPYTMCCTVVASEDELDLTYEVITNYLNKGAIAYMSNTRSFYQITSLTDTSAAVGSLLQTTTSTDADGYEYSTAIGEVYGGNIEDAKDITDEVLDLAMYSTSTFRNDAKLMVIGNAEFIDDDNYTYDTTQDDLNIPAKLMLAVFTWMYDSDLDLDMGIADKEQSYDTIVLNSEAAANTATILFISVPFGVALIGLIVWLKRRYS